MQITVNRLYRRPTYTIGKLYIDGSYFCDTLEDTVRNIRPEGTGKIYGKTAIPAGTYRVQMTYSPKFKRKLPLLIDVPNFTGVRIHAGNTAADTDGCVLVGRNRAVGMVLDSRKTETELTKKITAAIEHGDDVYIILIN
jgi:hypothetical protein